MFLCVFIFVCGVFSCTFSFDIHAQPTARCREKYCWYDCGCLFVVVVVVVVLFTFDFKIYIITIIYCVYFCYYCDDKDLFKYKLAAFTSFLLL